MQIQSKTISQKIDNIELLEVKTVQGINYFVMNKKVVDYISSDYNEADTYFKRLALELLTRDETVKYDPMEFIEDLSHSLRNTHCEIADILMMFDPTKYDMKWKDDLPYKYVQGKIPNTNITVEFDTLTWTLQYRETSVLPAYWEDCEDHKYAKLGETIEY